jgi:hypothetical protein
MSFSERYGYTEVRTVVQREKMDSALRTSVWNMLEVYFGIRCVASTSRVGSRFR